MSIVELYEAFYAGAPTRFAAALADIKNPAALNAHLPNGQTIIFAICQRGGPGGEAYLEPVLRRGADPNIRTRERYPPIAQFMGAAAPNIVMLRLMLEYGAYINSTAEPGQFLHDMCMKESAPGIIDIVRLAMAYGAKNSYTYKHWNLGPLSTIGVLSMLISPAGPPNGYRTSSNPAATAAIIELLRGYAPPIISPAAIRAAKLQSVAMERIAIEQAAAAEAERKRIAAEAERIRIAAAAAEAERIRIAAEVERKRITAAAAAASISAEAERIRIAAAAAEAERIRIAAAAAERIRIAAAEEAKAAAAAAAIAHNTAEGFAILTYAASLLETIHSGAALPPALLESIRAQAAHLLIKAGQIMPPETLATIAIPPEYEHLIHYKGAFKAYWEA